MKIFSFNIFEKIVIYNRAAIVDLAAKETMLTDTSPMILDFGSTHLYVDHWSKYFQISYFFNKKCNVRNKHKFCRKQRNYARLSYGKEGSRIFGPILANIKKRKFKIIK